MHPAAQTRLATLLLVALTAVWGSTFFLVRDLVLALPAIDFLAVRFTVSAVIMLVVFWRPVRALSRRQVLSVRVRAPSTALRRSFRRKGSQRHPPPSPASSPAPTSC